MYESFFKLKMKPFELLPNPEFLFMSRSHKRILSYLDYGIAERIGFILLTGEVGSGKTTVIRNLINKHIENVVLSKVFNTRVDSTQLIAMINDDFGLPVKDLDKISLLRSLNSFLIQQFRMGRKPVLVIDEAQNLTSDLLEEVRMLSNLETDSAKLLQIILVGQPELRQTLALPQMVQLRQRISINCHIDPLSRRETGEYIHHRLEVAGNRTAATFHEDGVDLIFGCSRGIPRLINILCDFIMLSAFVEGTYIIRRSMVEDIVKDLDFEHHFWGDDATPSPTNTVDTPPPSLRENEQEICTQELSAIYCSGGQSCGSTRQNKTAPNLSEIGGEITTKADDSLGIEPKSKGDTFFRKFLKIRIF